MIKTITIIGLLSLCVAFNSYAHDTDRIDLMEKQIQELKLRISKLESLLSNQSSIREVVTSSEGWKSLPSWRKLKAGMSYESVEEILGSAHRIQGGNVAFWYYQNGGEVTFMRGQVHSWTEPH